MGGDHPGVLRRAWREVNLRDAPRFFCPEALAAGGMVEATPGQAHQLGHVLRLAPGDAVRLFNPRDGEFAARIHSLRRDRGRFALGARLRPAAPEPGPVLAFALLKRDATDLVVQKATELGAGAIRPVLTERTQAARTNPERLAAIAREAAEQCERLSVPELHPPVSLHALLAGWPPGLRLAAAIERSDAALPGPGLGGLLVGPEGGFAPAELDAMRAHPFVVPVSLGGLVLRAETAAVAGLAMIRAASPR